MALTPPLLAVAIWLPAILVVAGGPENEGLEGSCPAGSASDGGSCKTAAPEHSEVTMQLRWRGFPYKVSNPKFKRTIYGGSFISEAFKAAGFDGPAEGEDWDILWTHKPQIESLRQLSLPRREGQRFVNHCSYFNAAGDKCRLARLVNRAAASGSAASAASLPSFELDDAAQLEAWRRLVRERPDQHWLLKPCLGGASKGIQIRRGQEALDAQAHFGRHAVAQQYLERPYLGFGGRKFHLRLYILVTRWSPAAAYIYDGGLIFRSVHAHNPGEERSEARDVFSSISKSVEALPVSSLWEALDASQAEEASSTVVKARIHDALRELLGRASDVFGPFAEVQAQRSFSCFDLFGADVLLDETLQPSVMEFNIGPNMWVDDHGAEHKERLLDTKRPLIEQTVRWASQRIRRREGDAGMGDGERGDELLERRALVNFTKLL